MIIYMAHVYRGLSGDKASCSNTYSLQVDAIVYVTSPDGSELVSNSGMLHTAPTDGIVG